MRAQRFVSQHRLHRHSRIVRNNVQVTQRRKKRHNAHTWHHSIDYFRLLKEGDEFVRVIGLQGRHSNRSGCTRRRARGTWLWCNGCRIDNNSIKFGDRAGYRREQLSVRAPCVTQKHHVRRERSSANTHAARLAHQTVYAQPEHVRSIVEQSQIQTGSKDPCSLCPRSAISTRRI